MFKAQVAKWLDRKGKIGNSQLMVEISTVSHSARESRPKVSNG